MKLRLDLYVISQQPIAVGCGRTLESLLCIQRGTTAISPKEGKVTKGENSWWWCALRRRGNYILVLIGLSRFCDHSLHLISSWLSSLFVSKLDIHSRGGEPLLRFGRYAPLGLRRISAGVFCTFSGLSTKQINFNFYMDVFITHSRGYCVIFLKFQTASLLF